VKKSKEDAEFEELEIDSQMDVPFDTDLSPSKIRVSLGSILNPSFIQGFN
jgi:hypothetical protein